MSKPEMRLPMIPRFLLNSFIAAIFAITFALGSISSEALAQSIPTDVELEGDVEVLHEDRDVGSRYIYFLQTARERLELRFGANAPALQTGDRVRARGRRTNGVLALNSGGNVQTLASALPNTFGGQRTLVILVNFYDKNTQPYSVASAQSVFNTTSNYKFENSYNQTWLTGVANPSATADVVGWFTINQSSSTCAYSTTASLADQAAAAAGVNLSQYTRKVYAFPKNSCSWWGLGSVGGNPSRAWINGNLTLGVVAHELGHNLGLYHSQSMSCASGSCTTSEYGDSFDMMGGSQTAHFNAFQKERLGWLDYNVSPPMTTVSADGVYWIAPYELNNSDPKALRILKSINPSTGQRTNYYVEYRAGLGFDSSVTKAVILHTGTENSANSSYLWDLDQATSTSDWILNVGQTYSDPNAGVTLTLLSQDTTGATVSVSFAGGGGGGSVCTRANPSVTLSPSSQTAGIGGSASYTVTVTNGDSSGCSSSTFNLTSAMPAGLSGTFGSSALGLSPGSSASTSLQVSSSPSSSAGNHNFTVTATNGAATTYKNSASGTLSLISSLAVSAATDKPSYARNQAVNMSATVTAGGAPMANVNVTFTVTKANGSVVTGNSTTGSNGVATYKIRLNKKDPVGSYQLKAVGSMGTVSGTSTTSFMVQ